MHLVPATIADTKVYLLSASLARIKESDQHFQQSAYASLVDTAIIRFTRENVHYD